MKKSQAKLLGLEHLTPSEIFWNATAIIAQLIILCFSWEMAAVINGCISFVLIGLFFDGDDPPPFMYLCMLMVVLGILAGIILGCIWIYKQTIDRFNDWLNNLYGETNTKG